MKINIHKDIKDPTDLTVIATEKYKEILAGYLHYLALENGGVDNWSWCGDAECDFLEDFDNFDDMAQADIDDMITIPIDFPSKEEN